MEGLRESPVQYDRFAKLPDHDITGLDIAMNHAAAVCVCDRLTQVQVIWKIRQPLLQAGSRSYDLGHGPAPDQLHGVVQRTIPVSSQFVHRNDGRVLKLPRDSSFLQESRHHRHDLVAGSKRVAILGNVREQLLHRDLASEVLVIHQQHAAHPAAGVLAQARVPAWSLLDGMNRFVEFTQPDSRARLFHGRIVRAEKGNLPLKGPVDA